MSKCYAICVGGYTGDEDPLVDAVFVNVNADTDIYKFIADEYFAYKNKTNSKKNAKILADCFEWLDCVYDELPMTRDLLVNELMDGDYVNSYIEIREIHIHNLN